MSENLPTVSLPDSWSVMRSYRLGLLFFNPVIPLQGDYWLMAKDKQNTWFCLLLFICTCRYKERMHCRKCLIIYFFGWIFLLKTCIEVSWHLVWWLMDQHYPPAAAVVGICCCRTLQSSPFQDRAHWSWWSSLWATVRSHSLVCGQRSKAYVMLVFPCSVGNGVWTGGHWLSRGIPWPWLFTPCSPCVLLWWAPALLSRKISLHSVSKHHKSTSTFQGTPEQSQWTQLPQELKPGLQKHRKCTCGYSMTHSFGTIFFT